MNYDANLLARFERRTDNRIQNSQWSLWKTLAPGTSLFRRFVNYREEWTFGENPYRSTVSFGTKEQAVSAWEATCATE